MLKKRKLPASGKADREKRYDSAIVILMGLLRDYKSIRVSIEGVSGHCKKKGCSCSAELLIREFEEELKAALECLQEAQGVKTKIPSLAEVRAHLNRERQSHQELTKSILLSLQQFDKNIPRR